MFIRTCHTPCPDLLCSTWVHFVVPFLPSVFIVLPGVAFFSYIFLGLFAWRFATFNFSFCDFERASRLRASQFHVRLGRAFHVQFDVPPLDQRAYGAGIIIVRRASRAVLFDARFNVVHLNFFPSIFFSAEIFTGVIPSIY